MLQRTLADSSELHFSSNRGIPFIKKNPSSTTRWRVCQSFRPIVIKSAPGGKNCVNGITKEKLASNESAQLNTHYYCSVEGYASLIITQLFITHLL